MQTRVLPARVPLCRIGFYSSLSFAVMMLVCVPALGGAQALASAQHTAADSDRDGMSDALEQQLLVQFLPTFMVGREDCSEIPAEFESGERIPTVEAENGTIYGQVFPVTGAAGPERTAEIHYYHLWKRDCGPHGHALDTEHVAVLVTAPAGEAASTNWKALYWYAAAHENTVCDVSQITRASTIHAEDHGAKVWISPGKHASYLSESLCRGGCGADRCVDMVALHPAGVINLGEGDHPMNGSVFLSSPAWPLLAKMTHTNFPPEPLARLNALPDSDIAWFNAGHHPAQRIVAISASTEGEIAGGGRNTTAAIGTAGDSTDVALSVAGDSTGNALGKSYRHTKHALGVSAHHVGSALHMTSRPEAPQ